MARMRPGNLDPVSLRARQATTDRPIEAGRNARVWAVVSCIPQGRVATYRQIAALAGIEGPTGARQVGYALAALKAGSDVPWHRVINVRGTVSPRGRSGRDGEQYERLAVEGVGYDAAGGIDLARYEWDYGN
jgi:methylated-DNA-protein-cysteine methyltransferase related protein